MIRTGLLSIDVGFSRLDSTRLVKAPLTSNPFKNATDFLRQDRRLDTGETIWVEGRDDVLGNIPVIIMTDAGRATPTLAIMIERANTASLEAINALKTIASISPNEAFLSEFATAETKTVRKSARKVRGKKLRPLKPAAKNAVKNKSRKGK